MDSYQAGLILALPRFDTYKILVERARKPRSREARIAYKLLKRRAVNELSWDIFTSAKPGSDADSVVELRVGSDKVKRNSGAPTDQLFNPDTLSALSLAERDNIYIKALESVGMSMSMEQIEAMRAEQAEQKDSEEASAEDKKPVHIHRGNIQWGRD